jgi:hypothetical protein
VDLSQEPLERVAPAVAQTELTQIRLRQQPQQIWEAAEAAAVLIPVQAAQAATAAPVS